MKQGYLGELDARETEFTNLKLQLEGLYMIGKDDKEIENDNETKGQFEKALQEVESLTPTYASTIKSVKMAIESWNRNPYCIYIIMNYIFPSEIMNSSYIYIWETPTSTSASLYYSCD
jgi:hypothetical protein